VIGDFLDSTFGVKLKNILSSSISPNGKRIAVAGEEIFLFPAEKEMQKYF
jgi:hypothetical protein